LLSFRRIGFGGAMIELCVSCPCEKATCHQPTRLKEGREGGRAFFNQNGFVVMIQSIDPSETTVVEKMETFPRALYACALLTSFNITLSLQGLVNIWHLQESIAGQHVLYSRAPL
jgi:hypothetical protein